MACPKLSGSSSLPRPSVLLPEPEHPKPWPGSQLELVSSNDNAQQACSPAAGVSRVQGVAHISVPTLPWGPVLRSLLGSRAPSALRPYTVAPGNVGAVSLEAWAQVPPECDYID